MARQQASCLITNSLKKMNREDFFSNQCLDGEQAKSLFPMELISPIKIETGTPLSIIQRAMALMANNPDSPNNTYREYLNYGHHWVISDINAVCTLLLLASNEPETTPAGEDNIGFRLILPPNYACKPHVYYPF